MSDGYEAQTSSPTRNAGAASVKPSNNFNSVHMLQLTRHSRFNGTKGLVGAFKRVTQRYCHRAHSSPGLYQFACRGYVWGPVGGGPKVKTPV